MIRWPALALAAGVGLHPASGLAQAVPEVFPDGEIEIGLQVIGFAADQIVSAESFTLEGRFGVEVHLAPVLDAPLRDLARGRKGHWLRVLLCGQRVINGKLQHELEKASFIVTAQSAEKAAEIAAFFLDPPCARPMS